MVNKFGFMRRIPKRSYMWRALGELIESGDEASGRLEVEMVKTEDGEQRALRLLRRKPIAEKLYDLPIIHADATLQLELAQQYLPKLDLVLDLNVRAPHMRVVQVVGMPVGKSSLEPKPPGVRRGKQRGAWTETPEEAEARVARKREALANACRQLMMGRNGLIITYKDIEKDFAGIENVEVAHFGAVEGIDNGAPSRSRSSSAGQCPAGKPSRTSRPPSPENPSSPGIRSSSTGRSAPPAPATTSAAGPTRSRRPN